MRHNYVTNKIKITNALKKKINKYNLKLQQLYFYFVYCTTKFLTK